MTALAAVIPQTRRVSAGIRPGPGSTSRLPAWWGRPDWLADVSIVAACHGDLLRARHVSLDAVKATARAMAAYADNRTGRDCRPTNERVVAASRFSLSVIQRARRVLKELGFVVVLVEGRSMMTRAQRLAAWRRGSSHRRIAATFALCSRSPRLHLAGSRRAPKGRATQREIPPRPGCAPPHPVDGDTPPGAAWVRRNLPLRRSSLRRRTLREEGGCAPGIDREGARRLAGGVRARLGWLSGTETGRLAPALTRFARAGWTTDDVVLGVRDARAALGWELPTRGVRHPAAYLARLLRAIDPASAVRPTVEAAAYAAHCRETAAAQRAARRAAVLALAGRCVHGVPAAGAGQPSRGVPACLSCRRESR